MHVLAHGLPKELLRNGTPWSVLLDDGPGNALSRVSPEATLARTRELLVRSRTTLDDVTKRLHAQEESLGSSPLIVHDATSVGARASRPTRR